MTDPYWKSSVTGQRLYRFANGHGASVVKKDGGFELAVTRITGPQSYFLNWQTPFGPPKAGLTEDDVQRHLLEIEAYSPNIGGTPS